MNELMKVIYERRAVRKYKNQPVEKNLIELLLDAGRMAPSAINIQPWTFYVLEEKELINEADKQITEIVKSSYQQPALIEFLKTEHPIFHDAPVVIFISAPKGNEWASLDIGMCAQNIMLAAKSLGLDTCPVGLAKFIKETEIYSLLNIPTDESILLALAIGYGNENPIVDERRKDNVFYIHASAGVNV